MYIQKVLIATTFESQNSFVRASQIIIMGRCVYVSPAMGKRTFHAYSHLLFPIYFTDNYLTPSLSRSKMVILWMQRVEEEDTFSLC
jgi:hypothetical protein